MCVATSGPGATNLITGIATAYMDSVPLVAVTGQVNQWLLGRDVFQEAEAAFDLLQDQGLISVEEENGRKKIAITAEGSLLHAENQEQLGHIQERLQARMVGCELRKNPQMKRALENFKAVLDLKVNQQAISETQLKQIVAVIDRAAMEISQLD